MTGDTLGQLHHWLGRWITLMAILYQDTLMTIETTVVKRGALYVGEVGFLPQQSDGCG